MARPSKKEIQARKSLDIVKRLTGINGMREVADFVHKKVEEQELDIHDRESSKEFKVGYVTAARDIVGFVSDAMQEVHDSILKEHQ